MNEIFISGVLGGVFGVLIWIAITLEIITKKLGPKELTPELNEEGKMLLEAIKKTLTKPK